MKCKECGQELKGLDKFKAGQVWEVDGDFVFIYRKDGELYFIYYDGSGEKVKDCDYLLNNNSSSLNIKFLYDNPNKIRNEYGS